jgi:hypothetical protein
MSNLSKQERDALDVCHFALPATRVLPIMDSADVQAAAYRLGSVPSADETRRRIIKIALAKGLRVPKAWAQEAVFEFAAMGELQMAVERSIAAGASTRLDFSIESQDDLDLAVQVIDHKGGSDELRRQVAAQARGKGLHLPRHWEALMSDFDKHKTVEGQMFLQNIHDQTSRAGAVCAKDMSAADFIARGEKSAVQAIHDLTLEGGAKCGARAPYFSGAPQQHASASDPHALVSKHVQKRNRQIAGEPQSVELSDEGGDASDALAQARGRVHRHVAKRNRQIERTREQSTREHAPFLQLDD